MAKEKEKEVEKKEMKNEVKVEKIDIRMDAAFSFLAAAEEQGNCEYSFSEQTEIINGFYAVCVYANFNNYFSGLPAGSY